MKRVIGTIATALLALLLPGLPAGAATGGTAGAGHDPVVPTDRGLVQGKPAEGIDQWLGIPYAAPPAGALRWAAPPPAPRRPGVKQAPNHRRPGAQPARRNRPRG